MEFNQCSINIHSYTHLDIIEGEEHFALQPKPLVNKITNNRSIHMKFSTISRLFEVMCGIQL